MIRSHHRRSIRLRGYDYSRPGAYFITICTQGHVCLFGNIVKGEMVSNDAGQVARRCWRDIPIHFPHAALDQFVVMPNHVHGIIVIGGDDDVVGAENEPDVGAENFSPLRSAGTSKTLGSMVRGFKIGVTKWMRNKTPIHNVWQRNFYEHIIRDAFELNRIRQYIIDNPGNWAKDNENSSSTAATGIRWRRSMSEPIPVAVPDLPIQRRIGLGFRKGLRLCPTVLLRGARW